MTAAEKLDLISEADYLAGELTSRVKHEYQGGIVHAMAGAGNQHNRIATTVVSTLHRRLRGFPCEAFNSDTKVRVRLASQIRYYYPDASVVCRPNPPKDSFHDEPVVIVEVLSPSTRRVDMTEKQEAYFAIPSLLVYILVEQDFASITVHRRTPRGFVPEVFPGLDAIVPLPEIGVDLPLAEVYERVEFAADPGDTP